ncbi:MAG: M20 metallopeptidase family protein [Candidatus Heimdallarchaeaceae archaeon]
MNEQKDLIQKIVEKAKNLEEKLIERRRHIHMYPETAFEEYETQKYIEEELKKAGYEPVRIAGTGVMAILEGEHPGPTIGLRADIDALNVEETNDVPYKSKNKGKMHACGHDAHTACLLTAAEILKEYKSQLHGKIKFFFQPAEEGGGGGKKIVDEGHLNDVDYIFGLHVWKDQEAGVIGTRKGPMLASADAFSITIKGKGGHAASPHQTIDPTSVLVDIYNALQKLTTREVDPLEHVVLTTPQFRGSHAFNIIPDEAKLEGTLRTFNLEVREYLLHRIREIVEGYSKAWQCEGTFTLEGMSYPPVINDSEVVDKALKLFEGVLDPINPEIELSLGGEDFAFYLQKTKGAFITLGIENKAKGIVYPHHHSKFDVDESVLWKGAALYAILGFFGTFDA